MEQVLQNFLKMCNGESEDEKGGKGITGAKK
jgi:hypothetical protein